jgi:hypothetical protein
MCLQVFRKKRTFSDFENVIGAMLQCEERFDEGWRKAEGYWGVVLTKCGVGNTKSKRKQLYMDWKRNINNFRNTYFETKETMNAYTHENDNEV